MSSQLRTAAFIALATFAAALALRLAGVGLREPWLDEIYSQFAISREWYGLAADRISRGHSPLYYALMKAFGIAGDDIVAMRTTSSVFDAAGGAILAGALARYAAPRAGLFFGILYAASPLAIDWAQNARPYGLLMLGLGLGVSGAMGLFAMLQQGSRAEPEPRGAMRLFGFGFSLASLTMTAGIFAFVVTAAIPFLLPQTRADRAFMTRWKRAIRVPSIVSFLGYFAYAGPHIARQVEGYWGDKYNTLGIEGLSNLWVQIMADEGLVSAFIASGLPKNLLPVFIGVMTLTLLAFALRALAALGERPALLAPVITLAGYVLLLIGVSSWTSVLVSRYFLPAWLCFLALAASGMALASVRRWSWAVILPLLAVFVAAGIQQTRLTGTPRDHSLRPVADIIARVPPETLRLLYDKQDGSRNDLIMELFPLRFGRAELERPDMNSFRQDRLDEALAEGRDVFAYMTDEGLAEALREGAAAPACQHDFGGWTLAYWGSRPEGCAR